MNNSLAKRPEPQSTSTAGAAAEVISTEIVENDFLQWTQRTPILGNNLMAKQFCVFLLASFLVSQTIFSVIGYSVTGDIFLIPWQALVVVWGIVISLFLFVIFAVYWNRYTLTFRLDDWGVRYTSGDYEKGLNRFVAVAGAAAGSAQAAGGGLAATSSESGEIPWRKFSRAKINTRTHRILLYRMCFPVIELFCPAELFTGIQEQVEAKIARTTLQPPAAKPEARQQSG